MVISVIYCACALGVEETCARAIKQRLLFSFRRTLKVEDITIGDEDGYIFLLDKRV
jgi:hypothetical protein